MSAAAYETFAPARPAAITVVDAFVRERGVQGAFPPPVAPVRFVVTQRIVSDVATALDPPVALAASTRGTGVFVLSGPTDAPALEPGTYTLVTSSEPYQTDTRAVDWPTGAPAMPVIALAPGPAYPFPDLTLVTNQLTLLRGSVFSSAAVPVAGAVVTVTDPPNAWPFATCRADERGGWVLAIPAGAGAAPFTVTLGCTLPGGGTFAAAPFAVAPGRDNSVPRIVSP